MQATILCYHKVGTHAEEGRRLNIEPSRLAKHIEFFKRKSYRFVRACDLAEPWEPKTVCFTFDDAYQSTMLNAPPIFERAGIKATFYAVSGHVGGGSDWDGELTRPLADWNLLRQCQASGHEIGDHSYFHPRLSDLSLADQIKEVAESHKKLVEEGIRPLSFCYPYGNYDDNSSDAVRLAGYKIGVRLGKRPADEIDNPLLLPRIVLAYSDAMPMLLYKLYLKHHIDDRH